MYVCMHARRMYLSHTLREVLCLQGLKVEGGAVLFADVMNFTVHPEWPLVERKFQVDGFPHISLT